MNNAIYETPEQRPITPSIVNLNFEFFSNTPNSSSNDSQMSSNSIQFKRENDDSLDNNHTQVKKKTLHFSE